MAAQLLLTAAGARPLDAAEVEGLATSAHHHRCWTTRRMKAKKKWRVVNSLQAHNLHELVGGLRPEGVASE